MRFPYLLSLLLGLVLGVVSMLIGIDREQRTRRVSIANLPTIGALFATTGIVGYLGVRYSGWSPSTIFTAAFLIALAVAFGIFILIYGWAVPSAARDVEDERYTLQGHLAKVTAPIAAGGTGEIGFEHDGKRHAVQARSLGDHAIAPGTDVVIERVEDGVAYVELWSTIEKQLELPHS